MTNPDLYAIVTLISGRRYYWKRARKGAKNTSGSWGYFLDASVFTADERKQTTLPPNGAWVSVLHGMGKNHYYPADSVLHYPTQHAAE